MRLLVSTTLLLLACDDHLIGVAEGPDLACDREPPLTWENFGQGHLQTHCTGCHSSYLDTPFEREDAPADVNLDTWDDVLLWADRIYERAVVTQDMPPGGGPDELERAMFDEWMTCEVLPAAGGT